MKTCVKCKQTFPITNFYKNKNSRDEHEHTCKQCRDKRNNKNKSILIKYLIKKGQAMMGRSTRKDRKAVKCDMTLEEFLERFEEQYRTFGLTCPLSGETMTHVVGVGNGYNEKNKFNISVDRIDNEIHYTKDNIMFVTKEMNRMKGDLTIRQCIAMNWWFKELYSEKYNEEEKKFFKMLEDCQFNRHFFKLVDKGEKFLSIKNKVKAKFPNHEFRWTNLDINYKAARLDKIIDKIAVKNPKRAKRLKEKFLQKYPRLN